MMSIRMDVEPAKVLFIANPILLKKPLAFVGNISKESLAPHTFSVLVYLILHAPDLNLHRRNSFLSHFHK